MSRMNNTQENGLKYSDGGYVTTSMNAFVMIPGTRQVCSLRMPRHVADISDFLCQVEYDKSHE